MWFKRDREQPDPLPTDTVGNPIIRRGADRHAADGSEGQDPRHSAPEAGLTRAERRMLEFVADKRVERTETGSARSSFWRVDRGFATDTKGSMLDWLREQGYIEVGARVRVTSPVTLTATGRAQLTDGGSAG